MLRTCIVTLSMYFVVTWSVTLMNFML